MASFHGSQQIFICIIFYFHNVPTKEAERLLECLVYRQINEGAEKLSDLSKQKIAVLGYKLRCSDFKSDLLLEILHDS